MGAQLVREVAVKTNDVAGDGTTTATLLADVIVSEGLRNVTAGADALGIRRGIQKATDAVVEAIKADATRRVHQGADRQRRHHFRRRRRDRREDRRGHGRRGQGRRHLRRGECQHRSASSIDIVEGMQYDRGYISPYMATDMEKMEAVLNDPYILLTDQKISNIQDMVPLLEEVMRSGRPLFIVAEDVEGEALATILLNKLRGTFNCVAIKAPGFGDRRKRILEDIAAVTGAQVIDKDFGMTMADATIDMMGHAKTVKVTKDTALIVDGAGDKKAIEDRIHQIKRRARARRLRLRPRKAAGAPGEAVRRRGRAQGGRCDRVRAQGEEVPHRGRPAGDPRGRRRGHRRRRRRGARGRAARARQHRRRPTRTKRSASAIIRKALEAPMRAIAQNAGFEGSVVVERVKGMGKGEGLNCANGEYGNMIEMGVNDPVKVTRTALQSAASVAALILITEATINDIPKDPDPAALRCAWPVPAAVWAA